MRAFLKTLSVVTTTTTTTTTTFKVFFLTDIYDTFQTTVCFPASIFMPLTTKVTYCTYLISIFRPMTAFRHPVFLGFHLPTVANFQICVILSYQFQTSDITQICCVSPFVSHKVIFHCALLHGHKMRKFLSTTPTHTHTHTHTISGFHWGSLLSVTFINQLMHSIITVVDVKIYVI